MPEQEPNSQPTLQMQYLMKAPDRCLTTKELINHNKKETREWWQRSSANEFGRLMKGAGRNKEGTQRVTGSDTFHFIHKKDVPKGKKITYARFCCGVRLQKDKINQIRLTVGGNLLEYEGKTSTKSASLETKKIHLWGWVWLAHGCPTFLSPVRYPT